MTNDATHQAQEFAASQALTEQAKTENLALVAGLSDVADDPHIEEHIRSMVAVTMGHLSDSASASTRNNAAQWQQWALGVADGVAQTVPAGV
jgi:hypothetical protein